MLFHVPVVVELIANLDVRVRWEKRFPVIEEVEELPKFKIVYWYVYILSVISRYARGIAYSQNGSQNGCQGCYLWYHSLAGSVQISISLASLTFSN